MPEPVILERPTPPKVASSYPAPIGITSTEVRYYLDVCDRYNDPQEDPESILEETQLAYYDACDWLIYGHPVQQRLTIETILSKMADYSERMRAHVDHLEKVIRIQYENSLETRKAVEGAEMSKTEENRKFLGLF